MVCKKLEEVHHPTRSMNKSLYTSPPYVFGVVGANDSQQHAGEEFFRLSGNGQGYPDL